MGLWSGGRVNKRVESLRTSRIGWRGGTGGYKEQQYCSERPPSSSSQDIFAQWMDRGRWRLVQEWTVAWWKRHNAQSSIGETEGRPRNN